MITVWVILEITCVQIIEAIVVQVHDVALFHHTYHTNFVPGGLAIVFHF